MSDAIYYLLGSIIKNSDAITLSRWLCASSSVVVCVRRDVGAHYRTSGGSGTKAKASASSSILSLALLIHANNFCIRWLNFNRDERGK